MALQAKTRAIQSPECGLAVHGLAVVLLVRVKAGEEGRGQILIHTRNRCGNLSEPRDIAVKGLEISYILDILASKYAVFSLHLAKI